MPINVAWVGLANAVHTYISKYAHDGNAWPEVLTLHGGAGLNCGCAGWEGDGRGSCGRFHTLADRICDLRWA